MRNVFCDKYQQELPGLEEPPYPGSQGQYIFDHISAQAWSEWLAQLTMIMNEHRLNPLDPNTKAFIDEEMKRFFANESKPPQGYTEQKD